MLQNKIKIRNGNEAGWDGFGLNYILSHLEKPSPMARPHLWWSDDTNHIPIYNNSLPRRHPIYNNNDHFFCH